MTPRPRNNNSNMRLKIAQLAAKIMVEEQLEDFGRAKKKAAERLKLPADTRLPANKEIQEQVDLLLRLYMDNDSATEARTLEATATRVRRLLPQGQLLRPDHNLDRVLPGATLQLHLLGLSVEATQIQLMETALPHQNGSKKIKTSKGEIKELPSISFYLDDIFVEITIFCDKNETLVPISTVDGRPLKRVSVQ